MSSASTSTAPSPYPPLLAPEFAAHTPETFHAHVSSLRRIPKRVSKRASASPRLPALKLKLNPGARLVELSSASNLFPLTYHTERSGRRTLKILERVQVEGAARMLLRDVEALLALLRKRKFIIPEGTPVT